jgi:hypothetical protein
MSDFIEDYDIRRTYGNQLAGALKAIIDRIEALETRSPDPNKCQHEFEVVPMCNMGPLYSSDYGPQEARCRKCGFVGVQSK